MLYLAGIVITFFLAVLLTGKQNKTTADKILVLWLCVIAIHLLLFYLFISGGVYNLPGLLGVHLPYPLLHGPLLFLYTAELTGQQHKKRMARVLHFLPPLIMYLFLIPYFRLSTEEKINVFRNNGAGYEVLTGVCIYAINISGIAYITASLFLLRRYKRSIENEFSNIEKINLVWLRYIICGIAVIWIGVLIGNDSIVFGTSVLFVFFLGYFGIRQTGIFTLSHPYPVSQHNPETGRITNESILPIYGKNEAEKETEKPNQIADFPKIKYEKSGLGKEQAKRIYEQLVGYMKDQKIFTDTELTLAALAKNLDVHPNHLSQVINSHEGKSFYDYINFHRVDEFKRLAPLPDNRNYTLLSLAYECGFNSKTSFNRNFKKVTGFSPTEWLRQSNISLK
jgi:AraC-like DNA-binding protein